MLAVWHVGLPGKGAENIEGLTRLELIDVGYVGSHYTTKQNIVQNVLDVLAFVVCVELNVSKNKNKNTKKRVEGHFMYIQREIFKTVATDSNINWMKRDKMCF